MNSGQQEVGWPSAVVATALLATIAAIAIAAIVRYSVDDALKVWSALGTLVGVVTGAFVTYFFTRGAVQHARRAAESANTRAQHAETAFQRVYGKLQGSEAWSEVASDPAVVRMVEPEHGTST
jgi:hypothetical protein